MTTFQEDRSTERTAEDPPSKQALRTLLARAGVRLNGGCLWDPQIHNDRVYDRLLSGGRLAAGGTYMNGW